MPSVWLATSMVTDVVLTAALSYNLAKARRRARVLSKLALTPEWQVKGNFVETNHVLDRIIRGAPSCQPCLAAL
jgi:hypothetical protein